MSRLTLLGLPIGNLSDLSSRARGVLESEKFFLAEDTRNLAKIMNHLEISSKEKSFESFHDHSKNKIEHIIKELKAHRSFVFVSDAGSPIISDPAYPLVRAALDEGIEVESVPGVSSVTMALELSGLPPCPFHFHGFLPRGTKDVKERFEDLSSIKGTHIFFESPYRMEETLKVLNSVSPDSQVAICRELTKMYETVYRFKARDFKSIDLKAKGEMVLLVHFKELSEDGPKVDKKLTKLCEDYLEGKRSPKALAKIIAGVLDQNVSEVYSKLSK